MPTILILLAGFAAQAAVDPALLSLVGPEAKVVSGIQVEQSLTSPFGKYVLSQMQIEDRDFLKFINATGFDPRRDLKEIVAATDGTGKIVLVGRGTFNTGRILAAATAHGETVSQYRGSDMIVAKGATAHGVAFLDASTAALGDETSLRAVIDRRSGSSPSLSGALATKAKLISATHHAWFVTTSSPAELLAGRMPDPNLNSAMQGNLLQAVTEASGGITFGASAVQIAGEAVTRSEKDAQALVDVFKFLAGLIQVNAGKDPRVGKIASLAETAKFSTEGNVMKLSLSVPQEVIEKLFLRRAAPAAAAAAR